MTPPLLLLPALALSLNLGQAPEAAVSAAVPSAETAQAPAKEQAPAAIDPAAYMKAKPSPSQGEPVLVLSEDSVSLGLTPLKDMTFALPDPAWGNAPANAAEAQDAPEAAEALDLELVIFGEEKGDLARTDCRKPEDPKGNMFNYASDISLWNAVVQQSAAQGRPAPLALGIGDMVFPGAFGHFLLSQGEQGASQLAELLARIPFDGMALGNHEFGDIPESTQAFFGAAQKAGLPFLGANIRCKSGELTEALCRMTGTAEGGKPWRIVQRGPVKIGITAITDPAITEQLAKDRLEKVELKPPKEVLAEVIPQMKADGADLVFVLLHRGHGLTRDVLETILSEFEDLDLMVTDKLFSKDEEDLTAGAAAHREMGYIVIPRTHTFLIGAGSSELSDTLATLSLKKIDGHYRIAGVEPRYISNGIFDPDEAAKITAVSQDFCSKWGQPLHEAKLARDFAPEDMSTFILNVLRFTAKSEVALMNTGAFRNPEHFPISGGVTSADISSTLPYGSRFIKAGVSGEVLAKLAASIGSGLSCAGMEKDASGELRVNGRPLDKKRSYSIVINEFLAEGSGGFIDPKTLKSPTIWQDPATGQTPDIAAIVTDSVREGRFLEERGDGSLVVSPDKSFPDLHLHMLWQLGGHLNASYSHMNIHNPHQAVDHDGDYSKSRLTATATDRLNVDFKIMANGSTRNHGWDNDFVIQYSTTRQKGPEESNVFEEDKDMARIRSAYKYLGQRADYGDAWYVPVPFVEGQVETELTKDSGSPNHPLDLTGIAGLLLKLHANLEFRVGFNIRGDVLEKHGTPSIGLFTGYRLMKTELFRISNNPVRFESECEYFFNADGSDRIHEFRWDNRVFFDITNHLALTASFNMYIYRTKHVGEVGRAMEGMVGINASIERMVQSF